MKIYSLYVLNKSGGLIYQRDFNVPGSPVSKQNTNDYLVIAGTLHSVHAIASRITPKDAITHANTNPSQGIRPVSNKSGLSSISTALFDIHVQQTITGTKFILFTSPSPSLTSTPVIPSQSSSHLPQSTGISSSASVNNSIAVFRLFRTIYDLYCNYVLKNPFYQLEMPIRCKLFDDRVSSMAILANA